MSQFWFFAVLITSLAANANSRISLTEFATSPDSMVRGAVAFNPNTPPALLQKLAQDSDPLVRRNVLEAAQVTSPILETLATDTNAQTRWAALEDSRLSSQALDRLYLHANENDKSLIVRHAHLSFRLQQDVVASKNPKLILLWAVNPSANGVLLAKAYAQSTPAASYLDFIAANPNTPRGTLVKIQQRFKNDPIMLTNLTHNPSIGSKMAWSLFTSLKGFDARFAANPSVKGQLAQELFVRYPAYYASGFAQNPKLSEAMQLQIIQAASEPTLNEFNKSMFADDLHTLALNPNMTLRAAKLLAVGPEEDLRRSLACGYKKNNQPVPDEVSSILISNSTYRVTTCLAENPKLSGTARLALANGSDWRLFSDLVKNTLTPDAAFGVLEQKFYQLWSHDPYNQAVYALGEGFVGNKHTPPQLLHDLYTRITKRLEMAWGSADLYLFKNPNLPAADLVSALDGPLSNTSYKAAAIANANVPLQ